MTNTVFDVAIGISFILYIERDIVETRKSIYPSNMRKSRELNSSEFINLLNVRVKFKKKKNRKKLIKKFEKLIQIFEYSICS